MVRVVREEQPKKAPWPIVARPAGRATAVSEGGAAFESVVVDRGEAGGQGEGDEGAAEEEGPLGTWTSP